ncbi:MAG: hypothetical protein KME03_14615 [Aphanocapsa lilacina HA4352-LM1]|nr:hypothetical protein [Aphanocapsa lilacina HA4352-LM1]
MKDTETSEAQPDDFATAIRAVHIELGTADLVRSQAFYERMLNGRAQVGSEAGYVLFAVYGLELLLLKGRVLPVRFGWKLADEQALEALAERFSTQGIAFERREFTHAALGAREVALNLHDPDGHRCSFYCLIFEI